PCCAARSRERGRPTSGTPGADRSASGTVADTPRCGGCVRATVPKRAVEMLTPARNDLRLINNDQSAVIERPGRKPCTNHATMLIGGLKSCESQPDGVQ